MDAAGLQYLPDELFEQVVQYLSLLDICHLRLVSRLTASKAAQDTYRSNSRKKDVDLARENLQCFVKVTSQSGLGCLVEDLSLVGIAYDSSALRGFIESRGRNPRLSEGKRRPLRAGPLNPTVTYATDEELDAAREDLATLRRRRKDNEALRSEGKDVVMLNEAFSNIVSSNKSTLKSLTLRIKTHRGDSLPKRWHSARAGRSQAGFQVATSTFWLTMKSLCNSQLRLQALDMFFAWHEQLECSLPCDALGNLDLTSDGMMGSCLSGLKSVSVSITNPMVKETKYEVRDASEDEDDAVSAFEQQTSAHALSRETIADEKDYCALSNMVALCPELKELNIVGYQLNCSDEQLQELQKTMRRQHLRHLTRGTHLPQLRRLNLSSLEVQDNHILTFLIKHSSSLRELELTMITFPEGSFSPLVRCVTSDGIELESIWLDDIREGREWIGIETVYLSAIVISSESTVQSANPIYLTSVETS